MTFAATVFTLKLGLSIGGALTGWLLEFYGYQPNVEQSARALDGIRLMMSLFPALAFVFGVGALMVYGIDRHMELKIEQDLSERRKGFEYATA